MGEAPTIELVVGYKRTNASAILALFLARIEQIKK
jgi:LysR family hca operon transcriptional activator